MILLYILGILIAIVHTSIIIYEIIKERKRLNKIRNETEELKEFSKLLNERLPHS